MCRHRLGQCTKVCRPSSTGFAPGQSEFVLSWTSWRRGQERAQEGFGTGLGKLGWILNPVPGPTSAIQAALICAHKLAAQIQIAL